MASGPCSDRLTPSRGLVSNDRPEPSKSRPTKRQRKSNLGSLTDDLGEVETHMNETSKEHHWLDEEHHWLDGGLASSFPPVVDLEASNVSANSADKGLSGQKLYTSSLYTGAFNLALDTVLAEECHLFSEQDVEIFQKYRSLPYEVQYLYVRLFLRKSTTWFRLHKLGYHSDISDIHAACSVLWSSQVGFAENYDAIDTLDEAASLLTLEELKLIGKDEKFTGYTTKSQLITALKRAATSQGRLREKGQLSISFDRKGAKYIKRILEITGPCIRLHPAAVTLFNRVHLVFYRSTEYTDDSLKTLILARTSKRNFPTYIVSRTANIFASHEVLVEFEESIKLQAQVDGILEGNGVPTKDDLQQVLDVVEGLYPRWLELVQQEQNKVKPKAFDPDTPSFSGNENEVLIERIYLRRFSPAWVFTRIVHKGLYPLARFKMHLREHEVLSRLLSQRLYHTARRGVWYQRKALIEEHYMAAISPSPPNTSEAERKKKWLKIALDTCCKGLQDPLTHITFHYDLQKRITKLEQKLKIPKRDQHDFGYARLLKPTERTVYGMRIQTDPIATPGSAPSTNLGRKTIWHDPDLAANNAGCSVERMCLSHYRSLGWKGYHCEGSLFRTLFAYLFYDILFLYVPNVFETEYQTCPLDLFTEAFYPARASEVNHRLVEIGNGGAKRLVREVWERERERETCVVGLDWKYEIADLEEIVECIPGEALAVMCKVICQEYQQRGGGMPDLFLWNVERKECMFAEVKSENDRLSHTQRLWIHVLSSAGIKVELCRALARDGQPGDELQQEKTQ